MLFAVDIFANDNGAAVAARGYRLDGELAEFPRKARGGFGKRIVCLDLDESRHADAGLRQAARRSQICRS